MVEISRIYLLETTSGHGVEAELRDAIDVAQLEDWKAHWQPALLAILPEMDRRGLRSQWRHDWHWDWDWETKSAQVSGLIAFPGFSVVCAGLTQGLMRVDLAKSAREPTQTGKPLVYVDYLEVAPWNRPELTQMPRYKGVGAALIAAAVALSEEEGFKGRVGLHSLPQSDAFYRGRCGMSDQGYDVAYQNLRYFEMTADRAKGFLQEEKER
jgi:hypothetical protein